MSINILNQPTDCDDKFLNVQFPLDDFQKHAINIINLNTDKQDILVTAHTGSGKTIVALYAILKSNHLKERAIYSSPIKTLSNQKYQTFCGT